MLALIVKDLQLQKKMLWMILLYIMLFLFSFRGLGDGQIVAIITAVGYMLIILGGSWEDKNDSDILWNSLPVRKWQIVGAKYLNVFVYVALIVPTYWLVSTAFSLFGISLITGKVTLVLVLLGTAIVFLNASLYFPFYFALGYTKSRYWNFIIFFAVFFLATSVPRLIPEKPAWVDPLLERIPEAMGNTLLVAGMLVVVMLVVSASFLCSLHFYRRREF